MNEILFGESKDSKEQINELKTSILGGEKKAQLARKYGISRETLYQYLRN